MLKPFLSHPGQGEVSLLMVSAIYNPKRRNAAPRLFRRIKALSQHSVRGNRDYPALVTTPCNVYLEDGLTGSTPLVGSCTWDEVPPIARIFCLWICLAVVPQAVGQKTKNTDEHI